MSIRGSKKKRPWLDITREETEGRYLSYQLFTLRRSSKGPYDDHRSVLAGRGFYDSERIRFTAEGLDAAYAMLYPRDKRVITKQILDITGSMGLAALWLDQGRINSSKRGSIHGNYTREELDLIRDAFKDHGISSGFSPFLKGTILFNAQSMKDLKTFLAPYTHYSMSAKLMLRKSRLNSGSKPADHSANQLLRQRG